MPPFVRFEALSRFCRPPPPRRSAPRVVPEYELDDPGSTYAVSAGLKQLLRVSMAGRLLSDRQSRYTQEQYNIVSSPSLPRSHKVITEPICEVEYFLA